MKRFFTLLSLFMLGITAINADNFVFVDKDGNVIEDGATITVTEFEEDAFGSVQLKSGLSVKNVGAPSNYSVRIHNEITRIDNGNVQVCFPVYCHNYTAVGTNKSEEGTLSTDEVKDIQSEWFPESYGECIVTYQAMALQPMANLYIEKGGPKVTIHYIYSDQAGVTSLKNHVEAVEYFNLQGRHTVQPQRGINIVRMSDGSVRKMLNK